MKRMRKRKGMGYAAGTVLRRPPGGDAGNTPASGADRRVR